MSSAEAETNSTASSRSLTASSELAKDRAKPSSRALAADRSGRGPRERARPSGETSARGARLQASGVAGEAVVVAEQHVPEDQRLRVLQVGRAGHERVGVLGGTVHQGPRSAAMPSRSSRPPRGSRAEIERDLSFRLRACAVSPGRAEELDEAPLDVHVNVLACRLEPELPPAPLGEDALETAQDGERIVLARMPCRASMRACAIEPRMSCSTSRRSSSTTR